MGESINEDDFLQQQQVEVQGSDFLAVVLAARQRGLREEYNMLDVHGSRLSRYWEPGDTASSVIAKRIRHNFRTWLNPDTYTPQKWQEVREQIVK
jgi:hypothetical protein